MPASKDWVRLYRLEPANAEIVHARYIEHRFARHAHEHFVIGIIERGIQQYTYRGARHTTPAGQTFFVNGEAPHTGEPADAQGYIYRTLCLGADSFRRLTLDLTGRNILPCFPDAVTPDPEMFDRLRAFHLAVAAHAPALQCESRLYAALRYLLEHHTEVRTQVSAAVKDNGLVQQVRQYLEAHYAEDVSLAHLGALAERSPFHVARTFSATVGLPPHACLESIRMRHARGLLRAGASVVDTALAVGYADQSHFTHRFRRHTGFTPGQYQSAASAHVKITQDLIPRYL